MRRKSKRMAVIGGGMAFLACAAGCPSYALGQKTSYFYMPADLGAAHPPPASASALAAWSRKATVVRGTGATSPLP